MNWKNTNRLARVLMIALAFLLVQKTSAQRKNIYPQISIQGSVGLLPTYLADGGKMNFIPLTIGGEILFKNKVSISSEYSHAIQRLSKTFQNNVIEWKNKSALTAIKVAVHYNKLEPFDIYGGLVIGANRVMVDTETLEKLSLAELLGVKEDRTTILYAAFVGGKYQLDKHLFLFGEAGFMNSLLKLGIGYNFKNTIHKKKITG